MKYDINDQSQITNYNYVFLKLSWKLSKIHDLNSTSGKQND
jgi:hypothetical protein